MLSARETPQNRRFTQAESEGVEKYSNQMVIEITLSYQHLYLTKIDFKTKTITKDKEGHYIILK